MSRSENIVTEGNTTSVYLTIETDACDMTRSWKPSAVLTVMQLATHYGQEAMGIEWTELAKKGALWVVSRLNITLNRIPKHGEKLTVQAIALPAVKMLFPWKFRFIDSSGELLGEGNSLWNLMDSATRRVTLIPGIADKIPRPEGWSCCPELPTAATELQCPAMKSIARPVYTDLDINGHVSHIRYIDWFCNTLGADALQSSAVAAFRISFMQEVRPDAVIDTELRIEGNEFSFSGYNADSPAFIIDGLLTKR